MDGAGPLFYDQSRIYHQRFRESLHRLLPVQKSVVSPPAVPFFAGFLCALVPAHIGIFSGFLYHFSALENRLDLYGMCRFSLWYLYNDHLCIDQNGADSCMRTYHVHSISSLYRPFGECQSQEQAASSSETDLQTSAILLRLFQPLHFYRCYVHAYGDYLYWESAGIVADVFLHKRHCKRGRL